MRVYVYIIYNYTHIKYIIYNLYLYNIICFTCNIVFHNIVHSDGVLYYLLTDYDVF